MKQLHAIVTGRVQGVGFRNYVLHHARRLGLAGWVRNTDDNVEVVAEGDADPLAQLLYYLEQGPSLSQVERVERRYSESDGTFVDFRLRW